LEDLEEYRQEVVEGVKDHWVRNPNDPTDERWEYTYHGRLFSYDVPRNPNVVYDVPGKLKVVNQFEEMAKALANSPITRRAQMITWKPWEDLNIHDPACLQSFWGRGLRANPQCPLTLYSDEATGELILNRTRRFRSSDSDDAAFMNDFAFVHLIQKMAQRISELRGEPVRVGRFMDMSDSYHIYGRRIPHFLENFVKQLETRTFEDRTWDLEFAQPIFDEAKPKIKAKIEKVDNQRKNS
jgi:thymidylate synthase